MVLGGRLPGRVGRRRASFLSASDARTRATRRSVASGAADTLPVHGAAGEGRPTAAPAAAEARRGRLRSVGPPAHPAPRASTRRAGAPAATLRALPAIGTPRRPGGQDALIGAGCITPDHPP